MMRTICCVALIALVAGCKDSSAPAELKGTYPLRTYRDLALPALVSETTNQSVTITAGTITLNGDLTFQDSYSFDKYNSGVYSAVVVTCTGHWTPTEESPQGGQLVELVETSFPSGCGDRGIAEWDHNKKLTIAWNFLGLTQHRR